MDKKLNTYFNIIADMPKFVLPYMSLLREKKKISTVIVQATELRAFLTQVGLKFDIYNIKDLSVQHLGLLDNEFFTEYFTPVSVNSRIIKESYLNMFYLYLMKERLLSYNPLWDYESPSPTTAPKEYLSHKELTETLAGIAAGLGLSEREASFAGKTQLRDMAVIALIYYANLSLSECAGVNLKDITIGEDLGESLIQIEETCDENNISDKRNLLYGWLLSSTPSNSNLYHAFHKTGTLMISDREIFLNENLCAILLAYISELDNFEDGPLFYSLRRSRLSERTIEHMVGKHFTRYAHKHVTTYTLSTSYKTKEEQDV